MTADPGHRIPWETAEAVRASGDPELVVDVAGFEGPLDLLLHLARRQKVDLSRISILALAEQYIRFIEQARTLRLELAADYLVTAAWLAFLKSKLLVPERPTEDAASGEELAAALQFRLRRLEAMRHAAERLLAGRQLGRDVFKRGAPQEVAVAKHSAFTASLHDLLSAYAARRQREINVEVTIAERGVLSLVEAREMLERLVGRLGDWAPLESCFAVSPPGAATPASVAASTFAASLELVREGRLEMRQDEPLAPLFLRAKDPRPKLRVVT